MAINRYLMFISGSGLGRRTEERLYTEIIYYLDDRSWPVQVRYHDQLPGWIKASRLWSNLWYGALLLFLPRTTLVVDYRLHSVLANALHWVSGVKSHELILVAPGQNIQDPSAAQPAEGWAGKIEADQIIVDTAKTRVRLLDQGVHPDKIRTLHAGRSFLTLYYQKRLVSETWDSAESFESQREVERDLPENLRETVDQLDLTPTLLSGSLETWLR